MSIVEKVANAATTALPLDLAQIQGIALRSYAFLPNAAYLFLGMGDLAQTRGWLREIGPQVTSAANWPTDQDGQHIHPKTTLNVAFASRGLTKLGIAEAGFSTEFWEDIAGPTPTDPTKLANRSRRLGDTGPSAPTGWEFGGPTTDPLDLMLMLYAEDAATLEDLVASHQAQLEGYGLRVVARQDCYRPEHGREPFGFRDGMSQPLVAGVSDRNDQASAGQPMIQPGEFVLGYANEYNLIAPMPEQTELGKNSTYLVFRKLEQDVAAFWNYLTTQANNDPAQAEWLASKLVGRWPSGAPVTITPDQDRPDLGDANDFLFADSDRAGFGCPVGSHIRRANPRDALQPDPEASMVAVRRHRLLRRGRVYGPIYDAEVLKHLLEVQKAANAATLVDDSSAPKGLALVAINADPKRQFEFIQQTWLNDPKFDGLSDNRDPLLGNGEHKHDQEYNMTIQRRPFHRELHDLPGFVRVRAGGYFFLPSLTGLAFLAG